MFTFGGTHVCFIFEKIVQLFLLMRSFLCFVVVVAVDAFFLLLSLKSHSTKNQIFVDNKSDQQAKRLNDTLTIGLYFRIDTMRLWEI